jgi:hypothetical protein
LVEGARAAGVRRPSAVLGLGERATAGALGWASACAGGWARVRLGNAEGHGAGQATPLVGVGCRRAGPRGRDGPGKGRDVLGLGGWARAACCAWDAGKAGWGALAAWAGQGKSRARPGGKEGRVGRVSWAG